MIDIQRQHPAALAWYVSVPTGTVALPGHALMELYQSAQNRRQVMVIDRLTAPLPVVWPNDTECMKAVVNFRGLHLSDSLGLIDALIAATAFSLGARLCTFNVKRFRSVPGLITEQPHRR